MALDQSRIDREGLEPGEGTTRGVGGEVRAVAPGTGDEGPAPQPPLGEPPTTLTMPASQHPGGTTRVTVASLRENMLLLGSEGETLGAIDAPGAGDTVVLKPDTLGQRHWIPLGWIARVDDQAHLDRSTGQARQEWLENEPTGA